jgi:hypothetical protein
LQDKFQLPLLEQAYDQFYELELYMQVLQLKDNGGRWKYIWGSGHYSSSQAYKHLIGAQPVHPTYRWLSLQETGIHLSVKINEFTF